MKRSLIALAVLAMTGQVQAQTLDHGPDVDKACGAYKCSLGGWVHPECTFVKVAMWKRMAKFPPKPPVPTMGQCGKDPSSIMGMSQDILDLIDEQGPQPTLGRDVEQASLIYAKSKDADDNWVDIPDCNIPPRIIDMIAPDDLKKADLEPLFKGGPQWFAVARLAQITTTMDGIQYGPRYYANRKDDPFSRDKNDYLRDQLSDEIHLAGEIDPLNPDVVLKTGGACNKQLIVDAAPASAPTLIRPAGAINTPTATIQMADTSPPAGRVYQASVNGTPVSASIAPPNPAATAASVEMPTISDIELTGLEDGENEVTMTYTDPGDPVVYEAESVTVDVALAADPDPKNGNGNVIRPPVFAAVQGDWSANSNGLPSYLETRTETHSDLSSGTTIQRVAQAGEVHVYSKRSGFNSDSSLMAISGKIARTSDGAWTGGTVGIGPKNEFNWSNTEPNVMVGIGNDARSFVKRNVVTGVTTTVRTWPEYDSMTMGDFEGVQTNDDRYVVLIGYSGGVRTHISFDIESNKVLGTKTAEAKDNWSGFSQNGEFIIVEKNLYPDPDRYITVYDKNFTQLRRIVRKPEHGDWGVDQAGNQVYAMLTGNGVNYLIANTGEVVTALSGGLLKWGHLSCKNISRPGYCYVSPEVSGAGIVEVALRPAANGSQVSLYGLPRTNGADGYNDRPMAVPNKDASMVMYHTNYQAGSGNAFDMLLKLPRS